ncbi:ankyrin repeat domain-containing protein [Streptomyces sp. NPDC048172]|uniref:ankyrin repeat domain-containing protein n=1 Tax=Streptomyces sp. NPDC048172 TaxID=3365505 RepID=UPI00372133C1
MAGTLCAAALAACTTQGGSGGSGKPKRDASAAPSTSPSEGSASPSPGADDALLKAAKDGDADGVRKAVKAGADLETRDGKGRTPLLLASLGDHVGAARVLVREGADPDAQDERRDSAWLVTGVTGSAAMARALIPAKPDYDLTNRYGGTSLIPAGEHGHVGYVREVLRSTDIKVNHVNRLGWTALLEAVILGDGGTDHQKVVALLLDAGADRDLADKDGVTALEHAERRGYGEIAQILRKN